MAKIALVGAGSTVFAKNLLGDILSYPELRGAHLALMDIDADRLATSEAVAHRVADHFGATPVIEATTDRRRALDGADHVITMFQVGGYHPATVTDFAIPARYGLRQTIGDTLGIGGIMRGLRTIPVLVDLCRDMEEVCPQGLLLQYVNPMAMNCWAISEASPIATVGLCHSVQGTAADLAADLGLPADEIDYLCAGINHMAFYLRFEHQGTDLYPRLAEVGRQGTFGRRYRGLADAVRYEVLARTGYFVTESSEHFAEYVPWFVKRHRPDLVERFEIPLDEYLTRCELQAAGWDRLAQRLATGDLRLGHTRSHEYGARIIHAVETGEPCTVYGNVPNRGLIDNLPNGCCVEVPCRVDASGVHPIPVGPLPVHLAALVQTNVNVQGLTVQAALDGRRDHVYHAAMLDPHTAAELSLDEIWAMVDELLAAHGPLVPPLR